MAQPITCDNGDGNMAAIMVTNVANGDTLAYCGACVLPWAEAMVAEFSAAATVEAGPTANPPADPTAEGAPSGAPFRILEDEPAPPTEATGPDGEGTPPPDGDATADDGGTDGVESRREDGAD